MFDDELADNVVEQEQPASPAEPVDQTKAFATRLKQEKAKVEQQVKEQIAEQFGYESWKDYTEAMTNNKLLDKGLDPESVRPVIKDLIKEDPEYIEAMKYKAEKEALEMEVFANNSIRDLNEKYGTNFKSVNELDEDTVKMWNAGTPLEKAYAANNLTAIVDAAVKKAATKHDTGKEHLKELNGAHTETVQKKTASKEQMDIFGAFGISREKAEEFLNRKK